MGGSTEHHIDTSLWRVNLHIHIIVEDGEDDIHHLLIMPLIIRIVAIRNRAEISLEHFQSLIYLVMTNGSRHLGDCGGTLHRIHTYIIR